MAKAKLSDLLNVPATTSLFGQIMLRDLLLPDLLGNEANHITYWAGRSLARKLPVQEDDLPELFNRVGFGTLQSVSAKRQERQYSLGGTVVQTRLTQLPTADFRLEAGFLAQSLQQVLGVVVEANPTIDKHKQEVLFTVVLDAKDHQDSLAATDFITLS